MTDPDTTIPAGPTLAPRVAELAAAPAAAPAKAAPNLAPPAEVFTFYFSAKHRATYAPGRTVTKLGDREYTAACRAGEAPPRGDDVVKVGTGTLADVTHAKP